MLLTASHRHAAENLLAIMYPPGTFDKIVDQMLEAQLQRRPEAKPLAPEIREFLSKYMNWTALKPDLVDIYAHSFTELEVREITQFYQTPAGRKMSSKLPELMKAGMEVGQRHVQEHLPELQQAIQAKMEAEETAK